jgi:hypothetical protein
MPGFLVHVGASGICPHGGQTAFITSNTRVLVSGQPALTVSDIFTIAGCAFTVPGPKPQPCVTGRWIVPATRILINGQPAILQASTGLCQSVEQIPQGPPTVIATQVRVGGI